MNEKVWEYRIVRSKEYYPSDDNSVEGYDEWLSIQEVYYGNNEEPTAHSIDLQVEGNSINDLRKQLQSMLWALDKDIVNEIKSETSTVGTIEDRVLSIEMETAEMRDRLKELDNTVKYWEEVDLIPSREYKMKKLSVDGHGNNIYESSTGDGTIYRESSEKRIKENLKNLKTGKKSSTEKGL